MAKRDEQQRKLELQQSMAVQRDQITMHKALVSDRITESKEHYQEKFNVSKKFKDSVKDSPTKWVAASTVGGILLVRMLFGSGKKEVNYNSNGEQEPSVATKAGSGIIATVAAFALKPVIKSLVINKVKKIVTKKFGSRFGFGNHTDNHDQNYQPQPYHTQELEYDKRSDIYM